MQNNQNLLKLQNKKEKLGLSFLSYFNNSMHILKILLKLFYYYSFSAYTKISFKDDHSKHIFPIHFA